MLQGVLSTYLTENAQRTLTEEPGSEDEGGHTDIVKSGERAWESPWRSSTYCFQQNQNLFPATSYPGQNFANFDGCLQWDGDKTSGTNAVFVSL